jgi:hypothetical protein
VNVSGTMPKSEARPKVGLRPVRFCAWEGLVIEPPVCVPVPDVDSRPATAVAVPPLEPLGLYRMSSGVHAFTVVAVPSGSRARPEASGPIAALPIMMAPAAFMRAWTVESYPGTKSAYTGDIAVVGMSLV